MGKRAELAAKIQKGKIAKRFKKQNCHVKRVDAVAQSKVSTNSSLPNIVLQSGSVVDLLRKNGCNLEKITSD